MVWETRVHSKVESYQRLKNWYLTPPCLTISSTYQEQNGAIQGKELRPPLYIDEVATEKGAFASPSTKVANFTLYRMCKKKKKKESSALWHREFWHALTLDDDPY